MMTFWVVGSHFCVKAIQLCHVNLQDSYCSHVEMSLKPVTEQGSSAES